MVAMDKGANPVALAATVVLEGLAVRSPATVATVGLAEPAVPLEPAAQEAMGQTVPQHRQWVAPAGMGAMAATAASVALAATVALVV
jgi:hypothetical protein